MEKVIFIAEKTVDGYSALLEDQSQALVYTHGDDLDHLRVMALDAYNLFIVDFNIPPITADQIEFKINEDVE